MELFIQVWSYNNYVDLQGYMTSLIIIIQHFLKTLFLENKTEISFKKYRNTFVMSKEVSLPIIYELNPAKIENQTKKYVPFIIHELGLHVGDEGSREST